MALSPISPGMWAHTVSLPRDSYVEYVFVANGQRILDPHNPHVTPDGLGHFNNYFYVGG